MSTDPTAPELRPVRIPTKDRAQMDCLVGLLADESPGDRWKAAHAVGPTQAPAASSPSMPCSLCSTTTGAFQRTAARAIGAIGNPRAIPRSVDATLKRSPS